MQIWFVSFKLQWHIFMFGLWNPLAFSATDLCDKITCEFYLCCSPSNFPASLASASHSCRGAYQLVILFYFCKHAYAAENGPSMHTLKPSMYRNQCRTLRERAPKPLLSLKAGFHQLNSSLIIICSACSPRPPRNHIFPRQSPFSLLQNFPSVSTKLPMIDSLMLPLALQMYGDMTRCSSFPPCLIF